MATPIIPPMQALIIKRGLTRTFNKKRMRNKEWMIEKVEFIEDKGYNLQF